MLTAIARELSGRLRTANRTIDDMKSICETDAGPAGFHSGERQLIAATVPLVVVAGVAQPVRPIGDDPEECLVMLYVARLRRRIAQLRSLLASPMTLGVRGVVIGENDRVLLVRHGYVSGWQLPGGGVEIGETFAEALARELNEEARVAIRGEPILHGIFLNVNVSRRDHVAVYVIREFAVLGERAADSEIEEARFFPRSALPEGTTAATRARLAEIFDSAPVAGRW